jgi:hypothetical protein
LLAVILAVMFSKSFLPGYVHFSNDGPLGEQNASWLRFPGTLTGSWDDLNNIGTNGGSSVPDVSAIESWLLGPVGYSKFYVPIALFILGVGAWTFFRQLKLSPLAAAVGALATTLNSCYVGNACWGTAPQQIAMAMIFFALALVMANTDETPRLVRWSRFALSGMCVGVSIMEGADNGAIFSVFVAAYVFFKSVATEVGPLAKKIGLGVGRVAVIAFFAALIAAQTIASLAGAFIVGTANMGQSAPSETPLEHWDWATEWSLPKKETLGIFIPGVFGYRMDTPKYMMDFAQNSYKNGEWWGGVGRTPAIDRFFDSGASGSPPGGMMRFGYAGYYGGILVALVALFAIMQSFRKENSIFPETERKFIWFWAAASIIALLLCYGRFAPFYQILYHLPYFSTIRNPVKFNAIFYLGMLIVFAYGINALGRVYLAPRDEPNPPNPLSPNKPPEQKSRWAGVSIFDRYWIGFCIVAFIVSVLGWMIYKSDGADMVPYLQKVGFPDATQAKMIFAFSVGQVEWFLLYLAVAVVLFILVLLGVFSGKRAGIVGGLLLGLFVLADLGRADLPFIIHWDYKQKYASNPIIDILRDKPYEHRVTAFPSGGLFQDLYGIEWMQHHFPYYNIQCADVIQSSRVASDLATYANALRPTEQTPYLIPRAWQLNNTYYFLGPATYDTGSGSGAYPAADVINAQIDPVQRRFHLVQRFSIVPKPGVDVQKLQDAMNNGIFLGEQFTAVPDENGEDALFAFTGALPRAKLYSNWQVGTNGQDVLKMLTAENFDPAKTVLVTGPVPNVPAVSTNDNSGSVDFTSYAPKDIVLSAQVDKPSVLLLNDKYDPNWHVTVDGKPAELLHANFIMRGVYLPLPGAHTVEFTFEEPHGPLYLTMTTMLAGIFLCCFLFSSTNKSRRETKT